MKHKIHFTKMHGAGNDYIYVDTLLYNIEDPEELARRWSDRHKGIGSDGLVLIGRSPIPEADFTMRIFNADGSEAMMCGNASRCVGKYVYEKGLTTSKEVRLLTLSGIKTIHLRVRDGLVDASTVDMGEPVFENPLQFLPQGTGLREGTFVSMSNPHYVVFTEDIDAVEQEGCGLEHHPAFPERCNIEFAEMRPDGIRVRVWERGSGITQACGTEVSTIGASLIDGAKLRQLHCGFRIFDQLFLKKSTRKQKTGRRQAKIRPSSGNFRGKTQRYHAQDAGEILSDERQIIVNFGVFGSFPVGADTSRPKGVCRIKVFSLKKTPAGACVLAVFTLISAVH